MSTQVPPNSSYLRIATEEAFATTEMFDAYRKLLESKSSSDIGFNTMWGFYLGSKSERATGIISRLSDLGPQRLQDMNDTGIASPLTPADPNRRTRSLTCRW